MSGGASETERRDERRDERKGEGKRQKGQRLRARDIINECSDHFWSDKTSYDIPWTLPTWSVTAAATVACAGAAIGMLWLFLRVAMLVVMVLRTFTTYDL